MDAMKLTLLNEHDYRQLNLNCIHCSHYYTIKRENTIIIYNTILPLIGRWV